LINRTNIDDFRNRGVVHLPAALDADAIAIARAAFDWSLKHPGRGASKLLPGSPGSFYGDLANPASFDPYTDVNTKTPIPDIVAALWQKPDVWYMYEQVFLKTGGEADAAKRTPWHQDLPYLPVCGNDLAVVWISFDDLAADESLEFIVGSHTGTLYDGSRFDPNDETLPLYGTGDLPRLPHIEANRARYEIVSFPITVGDVVVFHPAMLHGGAPAGPGRQRHTLSVRYFGEDAKVAWRPGDTMERIAQIGSGPEVHPMARAKRLGEGAPFRDPGFPKVH
jgi:ectoine hydroxylase-related dioxygenase (phytanoyl-CoA dioxygenase family)